MQELSGIGALLPEIEDHQRRIAPARTPAKPGDAGRANGVVEPLPLQETEQTVAEHRSIRQHEDAGRGSPEPRATSCTYREQRTYQQRSRLVRR